MGNIKKLSETLIKFKIPQPIINIIDEYILIFPLYINGETIEHTYKFIIPNSLDIIIDKNSTHNEDEFITDDIICDIRYKLSKYFINSDDIPDEWGNIDEYAYIFIGSKLTLEILNLLC